MYILFANMVYGQKDTAISFIGIDSVPGATKAQLFERARTWFNESFKSSKSVFQIVDKDNGELTGKGFVTSTVDYKLLGKTNVYKLDFAFMISVFVKDGKFKYMLTNFDNVNSQLGYTFGIMTSANQTDISVPMVSKKKVNASYVDAKNSLTATITAAIADFKTKMLQKEASDF
jgi:hypothetical protein